MFQFALVAKKFALVAKKIALVANKKPEMKGRQDKLNNSYAQLLVLNCFSYLNYFMTKREKGSDCTRMGGGVDEAHK